MTMGKDALSELRPTQVRRGRRRRRRRGRESGRLRGAGGGWIRRAQPAPSPLARSPPPPQLATAIAH